MSWGPKASHIPKRPRAANSTLSKIRETLEQAGIVFLEADDRHGPGVRLKTNPKTCRANVYLSRGLAGWTIDIISYWDILISHGGYVGIIR